MTIQIRIDHYIHHELNERATQKLDQILAQLADLKSAGETMTKELDTLTWQVAETITVEQSAIELLNGLSAQIASMKDDPAALQALSDSLGAKSSELAAAVAANTPAEPPAAEPTA